MRTRWLGLALAGLIGLMLGLGWFGWGRPGEPANAAAGDPPAGAPARLGAMARPAADARPIFDTHLHYSEDAWNLFSPEDILAILDQGGVDRALVSSTPDEGTLRLFALAPDRIVPVLRPYRTRADISSWTTDLSVLAYVEERLPLAPYRGIGEFHLYAGQAGNPVPRAFAELAARRGLFLHAHADAGPLEELLGLRGDIKVLWAHAGMSASAATIGRLVDRYPNLWVELALRGDVAPNGTLDPAWSALFQRHPDRFMIGTDTWIPPQWRALPGLQARVRGWLAQLPPEVADAIASGNAERLFGTPP